MPIVIDSRDLQRLRYRLEKASSDARRDMKRAMSSTQRATKTQAGRIMRETYTAGARAIANRTKLSPVDANALEFTLTGSKKPIELQEFKHSASKRHGAKVSVYQGGGTQQLPHAFKKSAGKSRLYQRIESKSHKLVGRYPIKVLRGPSAADILAKRSVQERLASFVMNKLSSEIIRLTEVAFRG